MLPARLVLLPLGPSPHRPSRARRVAGTAAAPRRRRWGAGALEAVHRSDPGGAPGSGRGRWERQWATWQPNRFLRGMAPWRTCREVKIWMIEGKVWFMSVLVLGCVVWTVEHGQIVSLIQVHQLKRFPEIIRVKGVELQNIKAASQAKILTNSVHPFEPHLMFSNLRTVKFNSCNINTRNPEWPWPLKVARLLLHFPQQIVHQIILHSSKRKEPHRQAQRAQCVQCPGAPAPQGPTAGAATGGGDGCAWMACGATHGKKHATF